MYNKQKIIKNKQIKKNKNKNKNKKKMYILIIFIQQLKEK